MITTQNVAQRWPSSLSGSPRRQRVLLATGAGVPALLYLFYVYHYSLNVPLADDWNVIGLVSAAIHHHLTMSQLWVQYADTRLLVGFVFFVAFGLLDHLNEKSIILFSAGIFVATYVLLIFLFRSYLGRRLSFLPVFSLGIVWFSLADVQNSLWSFQLAWYFVVFGFVAMAYLLLVPRHHRNLFFALGILAAVAASLAEVQGFVVWPVGLICFLWASPWKRRTYYESTIWASAAVLTTAVYLHGFNFHEDTLICVVEGGQKASCSLTFGLIHPVRLARFFAVLVGNVFPTAPGRYLLVHELLGAVICIVAGFVVVQSFRQRRLQTSPLPVLLIVFAALFDLMLALSRLGEGLLGAGLNRYTMPNIILLVGIVVYAWTRVPNLRKAREQTNGPKPLKILACISLTAFLVAQCVVATQFGISNAGSIKAASVTVARVVVNLDRIPSAERACYFQSVVVGPPFAVLEAARSIAMRDHLSLFRRSAADQYRVEGPPRIARCDRP